MLGLEERRWLNIITLVFKSELILKLHLQHTGCTTLKSGWSLTTVDEMGSYMQPWGWGGVKLQKQYMCVKASDFDSTLRSEVNINMCTYIQKEAPLLLSGLCGGHVGKVK